MNAPVNRLHALSTTPRRSDIELEARSRLSRSGYFALRDVSCCVSSHSVQLNGRVPTYYLKQLAQAIVAELTGSRQLINQIKVATSRDSRSG